jgi:hypothetical protein
MEQSKEEALLDANWGHPGVWYDPNAPGGEQSLPVLLGRDVFATDELLKFVGFLGQGRGRSAMCDIAAALPGRWPRVCTAQVRPEVRALGARSRGAYRECEGNI